MAFDVPPHFLKREFTAGSFKDLRSQYPVACYGMFGEVGFDRHLARIDWQLELGSSFFCFWRDRVPAIRPHLLAPILDPECTAKTLGRFAVTLLLGNSFFFFRC